MRQAEMYFFNIMQQLSGPVKKGDFFAQCPHFFNRPNCCIMLKKYISAWRIYIY